MPGSDGARLTGLVQGQPESEEQFKRLSKNPFARDLQKLDRDRKLYKRFSQLSQTFAVSQFSIPFRKPTFATATGFMNTYPEWNVPARLPDTGSDYAADQELTA